MKYKRRLKIFIFDFINGIRSNIPLCCTWFFSRRALSGEMHIGKNVYYERNPDGNFWADKDGVNYVRCDKCYCNKKVADVNFNNGTILKWLIRDRMSLN